MAIAIDTNSSTQTTAGASSLTWAHTCTGTDLVLFAGMGNSSGSPNTTSTATYNGVAQTAELWDKTGTGDSNAVLHCSGHYWIAPATGSALNIVITLAGADDELAGIGLSLTGVHQTTAIGTAVSADGETTTASATVTTASGELVVDFAYTGFNGNAPGANQTQQDEEIISTAVTAMCSTQAGADGGVMTQTPTAAGFGSIWVTGAVPFKPAAAAGRTTKNTRAFPLGMEIGMNWINPASL